MVFAKQPLPGAVKTRMCPPLSAEQAAELYACMLDDVLEASARACRELDLEAILTVHPAPAMAELAQRAPAPFRVVAQRGPGLSERMVWATAEAAAAGYAPVLLRGSDSPGMGQAAIEAALRALGEVDVGIAPDAGGGYSLVGMRRPVAQIFHHPMSTPDVARQTLSAAAALGLRTRLLPPCFDLDTIEDLRWLAEARASTHASFSPRTLGYLDDHDVWQLLGPDAHGPGTL